MKIDQTRVKGFLMEIRKNSQALNELIEQNNLHPDSIPLKAAKYILIELAEAMANVIQHILAKEHGVAVSGYMDTVAKGVLHGVLGEDLHVRLKPFFAFRNSLVHRYWRVNDVMLIENIIAGRNDFELFLDSVEAYLKERD
jgi:uncharacterized protein YutE (UPF0331/DUF86 family)